MSKRSIRVASWNIWIFGKRNFKGMADCIKANKIDVMGLQEVGIYSDGNKENMAKNIADMLGFNYAFYPSRDLRATKHFIIGNAILSKFPILKSKGYQLNPKYIKDTGTFMTEPRTIINSKIKVGKNKIVNFLTTHLQYSEKFKTNYIKRAEVKTILSLLNTLSKPVILTGDFNLTPKSKEIKLIEKTLKRIGGNKPTWTIYPFEAYGWHEDRLKYRLDNIFVSDDFSYRNFKVVNSKISDHLPIMADVEF
jgi:endonuclease/exonuclease/phosphatase family metal-dependent hydrolase